MSSSDISNKKSSTRDVSSRNHRHESSPTLISTRPAATVQTLKPFTTLSAIGIGYGVTNTAMGLLLVVGMAMPLGGSPLFFWGFVAMAGVGLATATTLAELASAMPHPGGQYIWVYLLAPSSMRRFLSYMTAMLSYFSAVTTGASASLSFATGVCATISLLDSQFTTQRWMVFLAYQLLNVTTLVLASFEHLLPNISKASLLLSCLTLAAIIVTLFAMSGKKGAAGSTIFTSSVSDIETNISGWPTGVAFIMGMNGPNWCFSCLDVATHLAEEIPSPAHNIPRALLWTVAIGFLSGLALVVSLLVNLEGPIHPAADNTALSLFYRITTSRPGVTSSAAAVSLWIPVLLTVVAAVWSIQTWQSRLAWTISREGGFPFHERLSRIAPAPFRTPIGALVMSATLHAILGCLYLGSDLAFNALISSGIMLQYLSYSIPVVLMLTQRSRRDEDDLEIKGRAGFANGPFWYPRLGLVANCVMLCWTVVAVVFYCFPTYLTLGSQAQMNYASVVMVAVGCVSVGLWFGYARHHYEVKDQPDHEMSRAGAA